MLSIHHDLRVATTLLLALTIASAWPLTSCKQPTASPTTRASAAWPTSLIDDLIDAPRDEVTPRLRRRAPDAALLPGSLHRVRMTGDDWIDEVTLFFNLRSDRVDAIVLKYHATLDATSRADVLTEAGLAAHLARIEQGEVVTTPWERRRGLTLRARAADKQGRMTLTVEATKITSPPQ